MMNKMGLLLCVSVVSLLGCSSKSVEVDNTPLNPTLVLTANTAINGYALPDNTGSQTVYTRPTLRRIDTKINYESWIARKTLGNMSDSIIGMTEKNLSWRLDHLKKTYVECPLYGCSENLWKLLNQNDDAANEEEEEYSANTPETCPMTSKTVTNVVDKKVQREINGFLANQYQLQWTITNTDQQGRKDQHRVLMDFWMTSPTESMKAGWKINGEFQDNYLRVVGANDTPMGRMLGTKVYKSLAALSGDIEKNKDMDMLNGKLAVLKGYPVSIKLEWFMESNTCPELAEARNKPKEEAGPDIDFKYPVGSLGSFAGGLLKKKAKDAVAKKIERDPTKPMIRYVYDVTSVTLEQKHDSVFMIPAKYKLTNRE
jgi:hypothetical protein